MNGPESPGGSRGGQAPPGYPPHGHAQPGYPPHGQAQPGYPPHGQAQPGYPPHGHAQPGYPPHGHAQPGYPPHGQALVHPSSGICVTAEYSFLQWMLALVSPVVTVYGRPIPISWGRPHAIPLPPGTHPIRVHFPWFLMDGNPAQIMVAVHPGYASDLKYSTSFFTFSPGTIYPAGFRPWM